jgi:hypothetical protein
MSSYSRSAKTGRALNRHRGTPLQRLHKFLPKPFYGWRMVAPVSALRVLGGEIVRAIRIKRSHFAGGDLTPPQIKISQRGCSPPLETP